VGGGADTEAGRTRTWRSAHRRGADTEPEPDVDTEADMDAETDAHTHGDGHDIDSIPFAMLSEPNARIARRWPRVRTLDAGMKGVTLW
jgi:hypothetical protein